jgi:hypothetical protein
MNPTLDEILAPSVYREISLGILILIIVIFVHGAGIRIINRHFSDAWVRISSDTPHWWLNLVLAVTIGSLTVLHLAETLLWALPVYGLGLIANMRDSYYYVLESYTTLGEGNVALPYEWRLVGPIIAISGLFTFGWTAGVLVAIMSDFGKLDKARARNRTGP